MILAAVILGRFEKMTSCVFIISLAISTDDTIRVGALPKCKNIREPYFLERA